MLIFADPKVVNTGSDPAEQFVASGGAGFDLGFTEPMYNGVTALKMGGGFSSPPSRIQWHDTTENENPKGTFLTQVPSVPNHYFSWRVELPPRPTAPYILDGTIRLGWKSNPRPVAEAIAVCSRFKEKYPLLFPGALPQAASYTQGVIYFLPAPDVSKFFDHITNHEFQHVADHRWIAEQIFGPIDRWARTALSKRLVFRSHNKFDLRNTCMFANYTISPIRVFDYWQASIKKSGDFFHDTALGSHPILQFRRCCASSNDARTLLVIFEITPITPMPRITLYSPPHQAFCLGKKMLDGNERMRLGTVSDRTIRVPDVQTAVQNATIDV
jgi:hypothetical protein